MADALRVNGNQLSWGSLILKVDDERFTGFTDISFGDKRTRVKAYGSARHHAPIGRSRGKYEIDPVKITGWKWAVQVLRKGLAARADDGVSYGNVEFEVFVQYVDDSQGPLNVQIERCVWQSNATSDTESPDPLKEEFECDPMLIRRNELTLFDSTEGQP